MTRTLYLIRHAEAASALTLQSDVERALTNKGEADARAIGKYFLANKIPLEAIHHSSSVRTTQTAMLINESLTLPSQKIISVRDIYRANSEMLLSIAQSFNGNAKFIALIGHNPAISSYAQELTFENILGFSPGMVVALDFEIERWSDLQVQSGQLKFIFTP